jgi:hypothetical protein
MLRYLRIRLFYRILKPFSDSTRLARMRRFEQFLRLRWHPGLKILDLGGQPEIWENVAMPLDITLLNLPGVFHRATSDRHRLTFVEGDGCDVRQFGDRHFDIVFSNSVIEHVGDESRQEAFAREVQRLGRHWWVQTPSKFFPIEAHCGMPGWWFYPKSCRAWFIERWRRKLPEWTEMVEGTRVLSYRRLQNLFPTGRFVTERILGIPKSYTVHSVIE